MCGDASYYCPLLLDYPYGNDRPRKVSIGYYSIGSGGSTLGGDGASAIVTRTGQKITEKGYYSIDGIKYICPAGRYGAIEGLSTPLCSGYCDINGYYCPAGSVSPYMKACGNSNVICPKSTITPLLVRPGYYTSDPKLELCSPGKYRNWTGLSKDHTIHTSSSMPTSNIIPICQLCPLGTYKPNSGDNFNDCKPCNSNHSISTLNRVTCECLTILDENYNAIYNIKTDNCDIYTKSNILLLDESYYEGNSSFTRYEEYECEPGFFCVDGLRYICPAGYYGSRTREHANNINHKCEGKCAIGYYCPAGSTSPYALPCGR